MRLLGGLLLVAAIVLLGRSLFALAWDGGTQRVTGDWILIGLSCVGVIAGAAMTAGKGARLAVCLAAILFLGATLLLTTPIAR